MDLIDFSAVFLIISVGKQAQFNLMQMKGIEAEMGPQFH